MKSYSSYSFATSYKNILNDLLYYPEYRIKPRGLLINEITNVGLEIKSPNLSLYENLKRNSQYKYIAAELVWYFCGRNDSAFITKFSKFWDKIKNNDGTVNSAYGNLIFTEKNNHGYSQYEWALMSLIKDKDSRQAILHFNKPNHQYMENLDFPCTLNATFQIRENCLNLKVDMRSNDVILGMPTDIAFFTVLQMQMLLHLRKYYEDLKLGSYTHYADSLHIYDKHFELAYDMLQHDFIPINMPEFKTNLIEEDCSPTEHIKQLELAVENDDSNLFSSNDPFYMWLSSSIFKEHNT